MKLLAAGAPGRDLHGFARGQIRLRWLAATAALSLVAAGPALAQQTQGGAGGSSSSGFNNGGASSATGTGGDGLQALFANRGGGGGGAGVTGGGGGADSTGTVQGGAGGFAPGMNGLNGDDGGSTLSGAGGGGGAHGGVVTTDTTNAGTITGGRGGRGGRTTGSFAAGGGGAGGYGVVVDGSGLTYTNAGAGVVSGGNGGNGGINPIGNGFGGNGGDGGIGVFLTGGGILNNAGSIAGGKGGKGGDATGSSKLSAAGDGGNGGAGIYLSGPGTIINSGSITGGDAGNAGTPSSQPNTAGEAGVAGAGIVGAGLTVINSGTIAGGQEVGLTYANAITFTGGSNVLELRAGSVITGNVVGTGTDTLRLGGSADSTFDVSGTGPTAQYQGFSTFVKTGNSTWSLTGTTTAVTPWSINQGTLAVSFDANLGAASGGLSFDGGVLQFLGGFTTSRAITFNSGGGGLDTDSNTATLAGPIAGVGGLSKIGIGTLVLTGASSYLGATNVNAGTLQAGIAGAFSSSSAFTVGSGATLDLNGFNQTIGSLAGGGNVLLGAATLTAGSDNSSTSFAGTISGSGGFTKAGSGTLQLAGVNSYTGATIVNGGVLDVEGTIANTSAVTVNAGGTLSGAGRVDPPLTMTINAGGTLAPGNGAPGSSMTIDGHLALQSGATYRVQLNPATASFAAVNGVASLGGATVNAVFGNGSYVNKTYTILIATGGVSGTFAALVNTNLPANFTPSLSYDAHDAFLDLAVHFGGDGPLDGNQRAVATALNDFFNRNGGIPAVYFAVTPSGLTQASGELGTASQQVTFDAMSRFTGLLTDPFPPRIDAGGANGPAGFADVDAAGSQAARRRTDAFAMLAKPGSANFEQRWNVWAAGFGGSQSTSGNATTGTNDATSRIYGAAVGADYRVLPNTAAGFALAGGGTSFGVTGFGSGRSDLFQAGAYLRHLAGPAYLSAALAYGWQDITTDRTVTIAGVDRLGAAFRANAWAGRIEGGYRFGVPVNGGIGFAPYAAAQAVAYDLPAYAEQVVTGSANFALSYAGKRVTDARSEFGMRSDKSFAMPDGVVTLRGRLAWAHDFNPNRAVAATFQALPGASFVVNGATPASDSALATASAEMRWSSGWSVAASFENEISAVTRAYAGKGVVRYGW